MQNILLPICCTLAIAALPVSNALAEKPTTCHIRVGLFPAANDFAEFEFNTDKPGEKDGYECEFASYSNIGDEFKMECQYENSRIRVVSRINEGHDRVQKGVLFMSESAQDNQVYSYLNAFCFFPSKGAVNQLQGPFR